MNHINTLLAHAALTPDQETSALIPPIHLATTYERERDNSYPRGYQYARDGNPTRHLLENTLTSLESGFACCTFASGMATCHSILQALKPNAHIIIPEDVYHGLRVLVFDENASIGLRVSTVDMTSVDEVEAALTEETQLIWVETPSNPLLQISDIRAISKIATRAGATLVVDGTWTTPILQRPFELGADLVIHSLTKYMAGHSDVLGGAVVAREESELFHNISRLQQRVGAVMDPFSCWLTLRGLRTLAVRLRAQCDNAEAVAAFLRDQPRIHAVHYPGLEAHPGHDVARAQMKRFGAMVSFEIDGSEQDAIAVAANVRVFRRATSLGGTESLIEHRSSMEGRDTSTSPTLLRLSLGLEYPDDLIHDLAQALENI